MHSVIIEDLGEDGYEVTIRESFKEMFDVLSAVRRYETHRIPTKTPYEYNIHGGFEQNFKRSQIESLLKGV